MKNNLLKNLTKCPEVVTVIDSCPNLVIADNTEQLLDLACGDAKQDFFKVEYELPDGRCVTEATVARVRNGIAVNYLDPNMRRRDPDCMLIGDNKPSDKPRFHDRFNEDFTQLRQETFAWLASQNLAVFAFKTGAYDMGEDALAIVPVNAAFFALGLALLQGIVSSEEIGESFSPKMIIYVAPPFRQTHFDGKQIVVHNRLDDIHEIFSYNLYPGPSAKKGVYGALIRQGEAEGWVTAHCSAVQVITPYDNVVTFMHEGASGSGKSEMLEQPHRLPDGRMLKGHNLVTGEKRYVEIQRTCDLHPICDDMALCHPDIQQDNGKLWLMDAEDGWFVRVDHINEYGVDPELEKLTAAPSKPLLFFNIDAVPGSRALIWEHIEDSPGITCPNPRVIIPRSIIPDIVAREPVSIDIRSMGIRTPPCTREKPTYGIIGMVHILPPALAWLWRLVAPRGFSNPSIVDTESMSSEGVGSYWPFSTGKKVEQANLLLRQIEQTERTQYILIPNQHIGAWQTGFMSQWLVRDYLARRGNARFKEQQIVAARCALLGYALRTMRIEGTRVSHWFLEVNTQLEVGNEGYDQGAKILLAYFHEHLKQFLQPGLSPLGRQMIECCLNNGNVEDYKGFLST
ncbi:MAG: DUF4914 domain-containing protein [Candidatus Parabeggiatoa sp. nov. 1]|nr:MAG: DUF4914 domain-containing protein [Gammaproteobacteria bacterium]